jgi:hypothetical protein
MRGLLIDPVRQTVREIEIEAEDFLKSVHRKIGAQQLDSALCGPARVLWFDNVGQFKPEQCYWRFVCKGPWIAGRAIVTAVSPEGFPTDLPETVPMAMLEAAIEWCEGDELLGLDEFIEPVQTEFGIWPRIMRQPRWREEILQ